MASTKLVFLAVFAVLLLHVSWCAMARHHHDADPCRDSVLLGHKDQRCSSPAATLLDGFRAVMTLTSFEPGQDGAGPAACDGQYHTNRDPLAAVSTEEYAGGSRCGKPIRIWNSARTTSMVVNVVDETDCQSGCIATSKRVWDFLMLDTSIGEVPVTWADE